ncbi:MAG: hypothetical protein ACK5EX_03750 [Novosphingobium sp.]|uniref:hypothetical protein n=1 Tax=Novosphingobium sp. TaxID=1874826 RepID=UPI00391AC857
MSVELTFAQSAPRRTGLAAWLSARPTAREGVLLGLVLAVLTCLPVLVAKYPQMVDYAAHLARYYVMLERGENAFLQRYYEFDWKWSGNLGADLLVQPLAALFGLEAAGRIIAGLVPLLTALGILAVEWSLRRRIGLASLLALCFVWSPSLILGFLNFGLAQAAALFAFAAWVRLEDKPWRPLLFMPLGVLVWVLHVSGWGMLGILVFGYEWHRRKDLSAFFAPWPLFLPFASLFLGDNPSGLPSYGAKVWILKKAIWNQAMRDGIVWLDHASLLLVAAVLAGSLLLRRIDGRLGWAAAILLIGSIAMPRHIFGGDLADARMIYSGLLVGCLALSWNVPRWLLWVAPALFLARISVTTDIWQRGSAETERLLAAVDHLPQGARVANLVVTNGGKWGYNTQEHIGGYAVLRKNVLINAHFAVPGIHMIRLKDGGPNFRDPSQRLLWRPGRPIDLANWAPARNMDWLWYVGPREPDSLPPGAVVVYRAPGTLVARLAKVPGDS